MGNKMNKKYKKIWIKHILKEGSRLHVLSYDTDVVHCNVENCEINKKLIYQSLLRRKLIMCESCCKKDEKKQDEIAYRVTPKDLLSICTNDSYDRLISYMERNKINAIIYDKKELHWANVEK